MKNRDVESPLGARPVSGGVELRVWAPTSQCVEVVLEVASGATRAIAMQRTDEGMHHVVVDGMAAGDRYRFRLDGDGPFPDPASRFQPDGVHGASEVIDPAAFVWSDQDWRCPALGDLVIYELHLGTFSAAGTFAAAGERLGYLRDLGVGAIELMPVADFAGARNWGYDGVAPFAPARCYGRPDDFRRFVERAHRHGFAVILDVVYNHLGPDGAYLQRFSPHYFCARHHTPWGAALNLDGPHCGPVRAFVIQNALHWLREYHIDGLRLDATHALIDDSPRHLLAELSDRVAELHGRLLIAEDHRNLKCMLQPVAEGGWGLDAVWADDLHHQVHCALTGESEGYYRDFSGSAADLARTLAQGWFFTGEHSAHLGERRGSDPAGLRPEQFVIALQNHDQIGNRAFGERLHQLVEPAAYRAASVLLLCAPETPLLFMGQEWAASTPFLYFTDHHPELGRLVTEGRRREFESFSSFRDPEQRERIPDPQAPATFQASCLRWEELRAAPHYTVQALYRDLLRLRSQRTVFSQRSFATFAAVAVDEVTVMLRYRDGGEELLVIVRLRAAGPVTIPLPGNVAELVPLLSSEDPRYCDDPQPIALERHDRACELRFARPGALVLALRFAADRQ